MSADPVPDAADGPLSTSDALAVLDAVDLAFAQILRGRCRASVSLAPVEADGLGKIRLLRGGTGETDGVLLAYEKAGVDESLARLPGCVIGSVMVKSGDAASIAVSVETELVDRHDANEADGNPLAGGIDLRETNDTGRRTVLVVRSGDHVEMVRRAGADRARGVVPPMGRHRVRASLGLGGGSHRVALAASTSRPLAGPLLARLGELVGASPAGQRIGRLTLGLVS